jgi:cytochrome o ubiquinol oxidase subunit 2
MGLDRWYPTAPEAPGKRYGRAAWPLRAVGIVLCLLLGGCDALHRGFLYPAGPVASATRHEFLLVCIVMLFVIGPVLLLTPLIAWHYRLANTKSAYRPQWGFNWPLEGLIWIPPTLIVIGLAIILWRVTYQLDPYRPLPGQPLEIEAVALDWKWLFIYPAQDVALVNRLVIPAGLPVHLTLTSATVMQSIMMPRLAGQIYAMAGMRTQLNVKADAPETLWGENVQFNGMGFQNQKFDVDALDADGFNRWLAETKAQTSRLDEAAYQSLSHRSTLAHPIAYGAVDSGLFDKIVARSLPSGHALDLQKLPPLPLPMGTSLHD